MGMNRPVPRAVPKIRHSFCHVSRLLRAHEFIQIPWVRIDFQSQQAIGLYRGGSPPERFGRFSRGLGRPGCIWRREAPPCRGIDPRFLTWSVGSPDSFCQRLCARNPAREQRQPVLGVISRNEKYRTPRPLRAYPQHPCCCWIGGHLTEPNEQNTQQSPGFGLSSMPQLLHS